MASKLLIPSKSLSRAKNEGHCELSAGKRSLAQLRGEALIRPRNRFSPLSLFGLVRVTEEYLYNGRPMSSILLSIRSERRNKKKK